MKNTTRQWLIACICLFYFVPLSIAQKNFVMVHGLAGGTKSLGGYAALFKRERSSVNESVNFEHNSASGISDAATDARNKTIQLSPGRNRSADIGIGHSMGALTAREMDRQGNQGQEKMFGGFVLLGSPNQGSKLVTSFKNGAVNGFLSDGCKEVIADPLLSIVNILTLGTNANVFVGILQNFDGQICNIAAKLVSNDDAFKGFQTPSINDFDENAPFLNGPNGINSFTSTTHKVSFLGNENGPVHWRLFGSNFFTPNDGLTLNEAGGDQRLVNIMNDVENIELAAGIVFSAISIACIFTGAWNMIMPCAFAAYQFFDGFTWLQQSESKYNDLIGAFTSFQEMQQIDFFSCVGERSSLEAAYQRGSINMVQYYSGVSALYSNPNCYQHNNALVTVPNNGASDAVVPLSRQNLPEAAANTVLDGVNHFELRDHPRVTTEFNKLFNGGIPMNEAARLFFMTP